MDRERLLLHQRVFPKLKQLCAQYNAHFVPVDLRWGVNEYAQQDFQTMNVCLHEVKRCLKDSKRPNFLILLGDRYGWEPVPTEIEVSDFKEISKGLSEKEVVVLKDAYRRDNNCIPPQMIPRLPIEEWFKKENELLDILRKGIHKSELNQIQKSKFLYSATHQEIIDGLSLFDQDKGKEQAAHVMACLRELPNLDRSQSSLLYDCKDEQVKHLKDSIKEALDIHNGGSEHSLYSYQAQVVEESKGVVAFNEDRFVQAILDHLEPIIHEELILMNRDMNLTPQEQEVLSQNVFRKDRARNFVGRADELQVIHEYISRSDSYETRVPLAMIAKGGTGKSALISEAIARAEIEGMNDFKQFVFYRFSGASPRSFKLLSTLETLTTQLNIEILSRVDHQSDKSQVMLEPNFSNEQKGFESFLQVLKSLSELGGGVIFIDALDQLKDKEDIIRRWLQSVSHLPKDISLIVSSLPTLEDIITLHCEVHYLSALKLSLGSKLLNIWLKEAQRSLTATQQKYLLQLYEKSGEVLALKLLFMRSLTWKSFTTLPLLPSSSEALVDLYFSDLERLHNPSIQGKSARLIERIIGLMISSRWGLSEDEIFEIPLSDSDFLEEFQSSLHHKLPARELPAVMKSRLWFDLRPFLTAQSSQGFLLYRFHHQIFNEVAQIRYRNPLGTIPYMWLVNFYSQYPLRQDLKHKIHAPNLRPLIELPHALLKAKLRERLWAYLTHFDTLMAMCESKLTELIIDDYREAWVGHTPNEYNHFAVWESFIRENHHLLIHSYSKWGNHRVLLQLAMEHADYSPVTLAADAWLKEGYCDWRWCYNKIRPTYPSASPLLNIMMGCEDPNEEYILGAIELSNGQILSWSYVDHNEINECGLRLWSSTGEKLSTFTGHRYPIIKVIELRNGRILSWSYPVSNTMILWSSEGTLITILHEIKAAIELKDNKILSYYDKTLRLWSVDGELLAVFAEHESDVLGVIELTDGRILSWSADKKLQLWSAHGDKISVLAGHDSEVCGAIELRTGFLLSWSQDNTLRLWSSSGKELLILDEHTDTIRGVIELPDARILSWSSHILRLCSSDGIDSWIMGQHEYEIGGVFKLSDGRILSYSDEHVNIWSTSGELTKVEINKGHNTQVMELKDGHLLSWNWDHAGLRLYSNEGLFIGEFKGHEYGVLGAIELNDGRTLSWSWDKTLCLWSAAKLTENLSINVDYIPPKRCLLVLSNGQMLYGYKDELQIWSDEGKKITDLARSNQEIFHNDAIELSNNRILSWINEYHRENVDRAMILYSIDGEIITKLTGHKSQILGVIELSNHRILSWSRYALKLWSSEGKLISVFNEKEGKIAGVLELRNGRIVFWSGNRLQICSLRGESLILFTEHETCIKGVIELRDERILSWSTSLILSSSDGLESLIIGRHEYEIRGAVELSDGRILFWSYDSLQVWSSDKDQTEILIGHESLILGVIELKNSQILSWSEDEIIIWQKNFIPLKIKIFPGGSEVFWECFAMGALFDRLYVGNLTYGSGTEISVISTPTYYRGHTSIMCFDRTILQLMDGSQKERPHSGIYGTPVLRDKNLLAYSIDPQRYIQKQKELGGYIHPSLEWNTLDFEWRMEFSLRKWIECEKALGKLINTTASKCLKNELKSQIPLVQLAIDLDKVDDLNYCHHDLIPLSIHKGEFYPKLTRLANNLKQNKLYREALYLYQRESIFWEDELNRDFELISQACFEYAETIFLCKEIHINYNHILSHLLIQIGDISNARGRQALQEKRVQNLQLLRKDLRKKDLSNLSLPNDSHATTDALNRAQKAYKYTIKLINKFKTDLDWASTVLISLTDTYIMLADFNEAQKACQKALEIDKEIVERACTDDALENLSLSLGYAGHLAMMLNQLNKAQNYYQEAIEIDRFISESLECSEILSSLSNSLNCLGDIARMKGDFDEALKNYKESLELQWNLTEQNPNSMSGLMKSTQKLANIQYLRKDYLESSRLIEEAIEIYDLLNECLDPEIKRDLFFTIGKIREQYGKLEDALSYIEKSLILSIANGDQQGVAYNRLIYQDISTTYSHILKLITYH